MRAVRFGQPPEESIGCGNEILSLEASWCVERCRVERNCPRAAVGEHGNLSGQSLLGIIRKATIVFVAAGVDGDIGSRREVGIDERFDERVPGHGAS